MEQASGALLVFNSLDIDKDRDGVSGSDVN